MFASCVFDSQQLVKGAYSLPGCQMIWVGGQPANACRGLVTLANTNPMPQNRSTNPGVGCLSYSSLPKKAPNLHGVGDGNFLLATTRLRLIPKE